MAGYVSGVYQTTTTSSLGSQKTERPKNELGKDDFLKLLVAELRNQDIFSAGDNKEFMGQLAQFSSMEQMQNVASGLEKLAAAQLMMHGSTMLGKVVEGPSMDDPTLVASGEVTEVLFSDGEVVLAVGGTRIRLSEVTSIRAHTEVS